MVVLETIKATVIRENQAIRLRARKEGVDRGGVHRVTGEDSRMMAPDAAPSRSSCSAAVIATFATLALGRPCPSGGTLLCFR